VTISSFQSILERTGYTLDVTTGQRKYGGPPPGWDGPTPGNGCEVRRAFLYVVANTGNFGIYYYYFAQ
jgi:hypothetical protein